MTTASDEAPAAGAGATGLGTSSQLFRFLITGVVCAVPDFGATMLLINLGAPYGMAKGVGFVLGTTSAYLLNRKFTFSGASTGNTRAKATGFALVYLVTFFVQIGVIEGMNWWLPAFPAGLADQVRSTLCWAVAQALGTLINFLMLKLVVFRD